MNIWMKVTDDEYEFPIIICDTAKELSEKAGVRRDTIASLVSKYERGLIKKSIYQRVVINEGECEDDY